MPVTRLKTTFRDRPSLPFVLSLILLLSAPFIPNLLRGAAQVFGDPGADASRYCYPMFHFAGASWREWEVPLWNPYVMLGMPSLAEGPVAALHPLCLLFALLPTGFAFNLITAACFVLFGLGLWWYFRAMGLGRRACFCGALIGCFSSALIARIYAGHFDFVLGFVSFPYLLLFWQLYRNTTQTRWLAAVSLAYAYMIVSGHFMTPFMFSLFLGVYVTAQMCCSCRTPRDLFHESKNVAKLAVFVLLGIGIASAQLLPSLDFGSSSFRGVYGDPSPNINSFPSENMIGLLCPRFFGLARAGVHDYWAEGSWFEIVLYVGVLPLLACVAAILLAPRRMALPFVVAGVLFFLLTMGRYGPLLPFLQRHLPVFDPFRCPGRYAVIVHLCLVSLAAIGLDRWFEGFRGCGSKSAEDPSGAPATEAGLKAPARPNKAFVVTLVVAALLFVTLGALYYRFFRDGGAKSNWAQFVKRVANTRYRASGPWDYGSPQFLARTAETAKGQVGRATLLLFLSVAAAALAKRGRDKPVAFVAVCLVLAGDLLTFFWPLLVTFDDKIMKYPVEVAQVLAPGEYPVRVLDMTPLNNRPVLYRASGAGGYSGNTLLRYNNFLNKTQGFSLDRNQHLGYLRRLPDRFSRLIGMEYRISDQGDSAVKQLDPYPRAFLAESPQRAPSADEALQSVCTTDTDLLKYPVFETAGDAIASFPLAPGESVRFQSFKQNSVVVLATSEHPRLLVLNEMYDKDWSARVNDRRVPVFPVNYLFRGVCVPKGISVVRFDYSPTAFRIGLFTSCISLLLLVGSFLALRNVSSQHEPPTPSRTADERRSTPI